MANSMVRRVARLEREDGAEPCHEDFLAALSAPDPQAAIDVVLARLSPRARRQRAALLDQLA